MESGLCHDRIAHTFAVAPRTDPWTAALERIRSSDSEQALADVLQDLETDWRGRVDARVTDKGGTFTPHHGVPWRAHVRLVIRDESRRYQFYRGDSLAVAVTGPDATEEVLLSFLGQLESKP